MRASRWGFIAATLLGLVAMHGLGTHGIHGAAADATAVTHRVVHHEDPLAAATDEVASPGPDHKQGVSLNALCVAILVGLVAISRLLRASQSAAGRWSREGQASSIVVPRARDPDPPALAQLSILRC